MDSQRYQQPCLQPSYARWASAAHPSQQRTLFKCPVCQTQHQSDTYNDSYNDRRVKNLTITCPNTPCTWIGSLHEVDKHRNTSTGCVYQEDKCTRCGERMLRKELREHLESRCPLRPYRCQFCKTQGNHKSIITTHYKSCDAFLLKCPNDCGQVGIEQKKMNSHLSECPEQDVKCEYHGVGCVAVVTRKDLETHNTELKEHHLSLAMGRVADLCGAMTQLYTMYGQLEKRLQQLEMSQGAHNLHIAAASTVPEPRPAFPTTCRSWLENDKLFPCVPWTIKIDSFEERKSNGTRWESKPIYTHPTGYPCCLRVYAKAPKSPDYISVYIVPRAGPNDDYLHWPFSGNFEITLLNQLEDKHHRLEWLAVQYDRVTPPQILGKGIGKGEFISHFDLQKQPLLNHQYLMDDCLYFRVQLS